MESARTLRTITRNLVRLYVTGRFEDMLTYQQALTDGLNRYDLAAVKQAVSTQLIHRS